MNNLTKNKNVLLAVAVVALVLAGGGLYVVQNQPTNNTNTSTTTNVSTAQEITTSLQIDKGEGSAVKVYTVKVKEGETALDQLHHASAANGFAVETKDSSYGAFVQGIDGLAGGASSYWLFSVNGKAAEVGAGDYKLQEGDVVEWKFTKS